MENKKIELIRLLSQTESKPISGEQIGRKLEISRTMVWKYIQSLQSQGYSIISSPGKGYLLNSVPDSLLPELVQAGLETDILGKDIRHFMELESTNDHAKTIARDANEGTVIIAEVQKKGRGRKGFDWVSPQGGIWMSIVLKPSIVPADASRLTLLGGLAVVDSLKSIGLNPSLKWPNDVLVNSKKICGILTEMEAEIDRVEYIVLGLGINLNFDTDMLPEEIRDGSTTISDELGNYVDRLEFVRSLLYNLEQYYIHFKTQPFEELMERWIDSSDTIGRNVRIVTPSKMVDGRAIGIGLSGGLLLQKNDGSTEEIMSGRCIYICRGL
ncbi:biotin--[acetyl-CoA-carboxylase] ligase [Methanohalophilus profundi]|uniref:biotin--[acetyl-CoA-carboxylase] ligase n=1 Tax=Methanohalophilus profundi TaxID=2138083 RepID=UPI00101D40B9|nr:biotin--[acetyl-CoA-carboxylase] ligase [Methanohalophilus profundi]